MTGTAIAPNLVEFHPAWHSLLEREPFGRRRGESLWDLAPQSDTAAIIEPAIPGF
jgi:hypothetical protein